MCFYSVVMLQQKSSYFELRSHVQNWIKEWVWKFSRSSWASSLFSSNCCTSGALHYVRAIKSRCAGYAVAHPVFWWALIRTVTFPGVNWKNYIILQLCLQVKQLLLRNYYQFGNNTQAKIQHPKKHWRILLLIVEKTSVLDFSIFYFTPD